MHWRTAIAALIGGFAMAGAATADPRLDEKVYDPYIENGVAELETRFASLAGGPQGGLSTTVLEGEYGLNDRVSLAVVGTIDHEPGEGTRLSGIGLESVIYLGRALGVDSGAYLEYTGGLASEPNTLEGKLLLARTAGRFQGLANLIIERPLSGPEAFATYGYALSATWRAAGAWRLGGEALGNLGGEHGLADGRGGGAWLGPQVKWEGRVGKLPFDVGLDAGWLFPIGSERLEATSQARIGLEFERRF